MSPFRAVVIVGHGVVAIVAGVGSALAGTATSAVAVHAPAAPDRGGPPVEISACRSLPRTGTSDDVALPAREDGTVWYADRRGNRIVSLSSTGSRTSHVPVDGTTTAISGLAFGADGALWYSKDASSRVGRIAPAAGTRDLPAPREFVVARGNATPEGLVADHAGRPWFYSRRGNFLARVDPNGTITPYRGPTALATGFEPRGMAVGRDGNLWTTDRGHNAIYRFDVVRHSFARFDLPTGSARPGAIAGAASGDLWFTMSAVGRVGRVSPEGRITEVPLVDPALRGVELRGIVGTRDGNVWVTTRSKWVIRIDPAGNVAKVPCAEGLGTALVGPRGRPWFFADDAVWEFADVDGANGPGH